MLLFILQLNIPIQWLRKRDEGICSLHAADHINAVQKQVLQMSDVLAYKLCENGVVSSSIVKLHNLIDLG